MKINKLAGIISAFVSLLVFRILLDFSYIYFVSPLYGYTGFALDVNIIKLIESYLAFLLLYPFLPRKADRVSNIIVYLFFVMAYIPLQSYYALSNEDRTWFYLATLFWFLVVTFNSSRIKISFPRPPQKTFTNLFLISMAFIALSLVLIYSFIDISLSFDLTEVYDIRKTYEDAQIPFSGYLINWTAKVILPYIVLISIFNSRNRIFYFPLFIAVCGIILLFSGTGHKSYLFLIFMAIGFGWLIQSGKLFFKLNLGLSCIIFLGILLSLMLDEIMFGSLFIRRVFFMPARISFCYYDFFSGNPLYLSHSFLRYFFEYPYDLFPAKLIGKLYFNNPETNANNGILADAFMNFGIIGMFIWGLMLVFLLKLSDGVTYMKNKRVLWPLLIVSFYTMINGFFFTTLLTHGLLLALLIAYFYPLSNQNLK